MAYIFFIYWLIGSSNLDLVNIFTDFIKVGHKMENGKHNERLYRKFTHIT